MVGTLRFTHPTATPCRILTCFSQAEYQYCAKVIFYKGLLVLNTLSFVTHPELLVSNYIIAQLILINYFLFLFQYLIMAL